MDAGKHVVIRSRDDDAGEVDAMIAAATATGQGRDLAAVRFRKPSSDVRAIHSGARKLYYAAAP